LKFECRIARADQVVRWISVNGEYIRDEHGAPISLMGTVTDATERRNAEEVLRLQERILHDMKEGVCLFRASAGTILFANPAFESMFGYDKGELNGKSATILNAPSPKSPSQVADEIIEALDRLGMWDGDVLNIRKNGQAFWTHAIVSTMDHHQHGRIWVSVQQDITDRKKAEEELRRFNTDLEKRIAERTADLEIANRDLKAEIAERMNAEQSLRQANQELEAFSYSIAHDLRTPLRGIAGLSNILQEDYAKIISEDGKNTLRRLQINVKKMSDLIEDLLKLSRLTQLDMNLAAVDLSALARSVADELKAGEPGRSVTFEIPPKLEVRGDTQLLRVMIENLIGNAWKFTSKHAQARIEVGVAHEGGQSVYFVRDDGAGFDMNHAAKLFTPFHRLHRDSEFPGIGIGLSLVQRIVQRHGGHIHAEAAIEKGATFYFTLST
jgi:PAS domain S-box-containing protein